MPSRRRRGLTALAAGLLALGAAPRVARASSPTVAAARAAYDRATFDTAITLFNEALRDARSSPADLVEAHRYLATLAMAAGDTDTAARHVAIALALDPAAVPADGSPPEVDVIFRRVRTERRGARLGLSLRAATAPQAQRGFRVTAQLTGAPPGWSPTLSARCDRAAVPVASDEARVPPGDALALAVPAQPARAALSCEARLVSPEGVLVARARLDVVVPPPSPNVGLYVGVSVGATALVGGVLAGVLIWSAGQDRARLGAPMYIGP